VYYYELTPEKKRRYLGNGDKERVRLIKEAHYLEHAVRIIDRDLDLLDMLLREFQSTDHADVVNSLPKVYRDAVVTLNASEEDSYGAEWKREKEAYKSQFEIKYPEGLTEIAPDGTPIRSKSEGLVIALLNAYGIPYVYELPHIIDGKDLRPDFTVLSRRDNKTEVIIEYLGLMEYRNYVNSLAWKIRVYSNAGYVFSKDFFLVGESRRGFDPSSIRKIIENWLLPES